MTMDYLRSLIRIARTVYPKPAWTGLGQQVLFVFRHLWHYRHSRRWLEYLATDRMVPVAQETPSLYRKPIRPYLSINWSDAAKVAAMISQTQTFGLGGLAETVESGGNPLAGPQNSKRLTPTVGRQSATDLFDGNTFSHDSLNQLLNWALVANGARDYPADTKGYTRGFAAALKRTTLQLASHRGYNRIRGPVAINTLRLNSEF